MAVALEFKISAAAVVLGISSSASQQEIRDAYKRRAIETHPDKGGLPEDFRAVKEAYESLIRQLLEPPIPKARDSKSRAKNPADAVRKRARRQTREWRKSPTAKIRKRESSPRALAREFGFFPKYPRIEVFATL
mmetsp:Transcript_99944/g.158178  ORF Transcript_99944/g.158178 Transcript_99944/m.158178 type:complete len:134 (+) Transcript_99944:110-511(+)|eukprot:CAMPEP_0169085126 /NCGR_PEP_ID=MMETSP1015-20121227/12991_1 /TAXON_ID=342587 /ORGANISM="Karlodinium micrum, Strain CCMP2283" /LENGTH=133 /DNA_ID=CAMNT_0009145187 /DNA_START=100 /DNA_END=501 /DNA_ORIENTATION=+